MSYLVFILVWIVSDIFGDLAVRVIFQDVSCITFGANLHAFLRQAVIIVPIMVHSGCLWVMLSIFTRCIVHVCSYLIYIDFIANRYGNQAKQGLSKDSFSSVFV